MSQTHNHAHGTDVTGWRLGASVWLTLAFVAGEAVAGYWGNSLALMADAGHNLADALALGLSWFARRLARRPADSRRTYGYHRAGILAALANAVALVVIGLAVAWEAVERLRTPEPVSGGLMAGVALVAFVLNGLISLWLRAGSRHDLNVRSAYLHMVGDAVSSIGVILAGVIVALTGWLEVDPIVSLLIAGLVLWSSWGVLCEAVDVLLEAVPAGLDVAAVARTAGSVSGVCGVHDLHVWTVGPGVIACSLHIVVAEMTAREGQQIVQAVAAALKDTQGVIHSTVQVEVEDTHFSQPECTIPVHENHDGRHRTD